MTGNVPQSFNIVYRDEPASHRGELHTEESFTQDENHTGFL